MSAGNPVARLIDTVKEANSWSDTYIAGRARRAGHKVSKSWISGLRNKGMATLVPSTVRALSDGLGVPVTEVVRAALDGMSLPYVDRGLSPELAIKADPDIPQNIKEVLLSMLSALRTSVTGPGMVYEAEIQVSYDESAARDTDAEEAARASAQLLMQAEADRADDNPSAARKVTERKRRGPKTS